MLESPCHSWAGKVASVQSVHPLTCGCSCCPLSFVSLHRFQSLIDRSCISEKAAAANCCVAVVVRPAAVSSWSSTTSSLTVDEDSITTRHHKRSTRTKAAKARGQPSLLSRQQKRSRMQGLVPCCCSRCGLAVVVTLRLLVLLQTTAWHPLLWRCDSCCDF